MSIYRENMKKIGTIFIVTMILMSYKMTFVSAQTGTGDFIVSGGNNNVDYTYENDTLSILTDTPLVISGNVSNEKLLIKETTAHLTFDNLNLRANGETDIRIENSQVELTLKNTNTLEKASLYVLDHSYLKVDGDGSLTITATQHDYAGMSAIIVEKSTLEVMSGTIVANATEGKDGCFGGAGIELKKASTLIINDGTVIARGGEGRSDYNGGHYGGAGIGTGCGVPESEAVFDVIINGGHVTATGGRWSAGIGLGAGGTTTLDTNIVLNGGHITATGGNGASSYGNDSSSSIPVQNNYDIINKFVLNHFESPQLLATPDKSATVSGNKIISKDVSLTWKDEKAQVMQDTDLFAINKQYLVTFNIQIEDNSILTNNFVIENVAGIENVTVKKMTSQIYSIEILFEKVVKKLEPTYTIPQNMSAQFGQTLQQVQLPHGFSWKDETQKLEKLGVHKYLATYTPDNLEYYNSVDNIEIELNVVRMNNQWEEELSIQDWSYGEINSIPTAKAKYGNVEYSYSQTKTGKYTSVVPTDAGHWYVKASVAEGDNYAGLESICEFNITKAENQWLQNLSISNWKFDDEAQTPVSVSKYGNVEYSYSQTKTGKYTSVVPTDAGHWYVKASVAEGDNYTGLESICEFNITKAENQWLQNLSISNWKFGDEAQTPVSVSKYGNVEYSYSQTKTGKYTSVVPTDAGHWYVKASVAEGDNYAGLESICEFNITKAENQWLQNLSISNWKFGDEAQTPVSVSKYGNVEYSYSQTKTGKYTSVVPTDAGHWYVKASVAEGDNYTGLESICEFNITKAENQWLQNLSISNWKFGDEAQTPVSVSKFGKVDYLYSSQVNGSFTPSIPTNPGVWYVKAVVLETDNYRKLISEPVSFIIENKETEDISHTIIDDEVVKTYDQNQFAVWAIVAGISLGFIIVYRHRLKVKQK